MCIRDRSTTGAMVGSCCAQPPMSPKSGRIRHRMPFLVHIANPHDGCIIQPELLEVSNEQLGLVLGAIQVRRLHNEVALVMTCRVE